MHACRSTLEDPTATTLAVNLAQELQLAVGGDSRALVVDLDTYYGAVGPYLGVEGEYGILDLMDRTGPLDGHLVETSSVAYSDKMHVLMSTSTQRLGQPANYSPARLGSAAGACASAYTVTVIDAPRIGIDAAAELIRSSDVTLLPLQLTVKDIRTARRMLGILAPGGAGSVGGRGALIPIVTRYAKRTAMITLAEAKQALGGFELGTLSNDYTAAIQSLNLGKPLAQSAPRSDLRREIQQFAARLAGAYVKQQSYAYSSSPVAGGKR